MNQDQSLREHLLSLLRGGNAHLKFAAAVKDVPTSLRGVRPPNCSHSLWELLEHMRIAQWDILEFARNPKHVSPEFPDGYWPPTPTPPSTKAWDESLAAFHHDHADLLAMAADTTLNLHARIPHGDGQTLLRELLLVADHNAYHLGQFVLVRQLLKNW